MFYPSGRLYANNSIYKKTARLIMIVGLEKTVLTSHREAKFIQGHSKTWLNLKKL